MVPNSRPDVSRRFRDGYGECGISVQSGDADLDLRDLAVCPNSFIQCILVSKRLRR